MRALNITDTASQKFLKFLPVRINNNIMAQHKHGREKEMKRLAAIMLVLLLMLSFAACNNNEESGNTNASNSTTSTPEGDQVYRPNIPEGTDFGNQEFIILTTAYDPSSAEMTEFGAMKDELQATVVNEAVWERNNVIEETLNCKITEQLIQSQNRTASGPMVTTIRTYVDGNQPGVYIVSPSLYQAAVLATDGYLLDLMEIDSMNDCSDPWWDKSFVEETSIHDQVKFITGDIGYQGRTSITAVFFNKELARNSDIGDPYALVRQKKWTLDVIIEWSKLISNDDNGDGTIDYRDSFGMGGQNDNMWAFFFSAGERLARKDDTGTPEITIYNERSARVVEKIATLMQNKNYYVNANFLFSVSATPVDLLITAFKEGRSLLFCDALLNVELLRDMDIDFGILPSPLYDETQEEYASLMNPWSANAFGVPANLDEQSAEDAGLLMQFLGAEGKNKLMPAFFEVAFKGQKVRDDDSAAMLDIIFNNVGCDIGHIYNWGSLGSTVLHQVSESKGEFTSLCDANVAAAEQALKDTLDAIK